MSEISKLEQNLIIKKIDTVDLIGVYGDEDKNELTNSSAVNVNIT